MEFAAKYAVSFLFDAPDAFLISDRILFGKNELLCHLIT